MRPPFVLVSDTVSTDTVTCLRALLSAARRGELIGLCFVGMLKKRAYIVNSTGAAHDSPTFARGMIAALDDQLAQRIRGGNP